VKMLADTSALLAMVLSNDRHHHAAAGFVRAHREVRYLLTDLILVEVATRLRARADAERAVSFCRDLLGSTRYQVLFVDAELFDGALRQMQRLADKRLSLTDCASFEVMHRLGVSTAFSFDRDFRDCGFAMVP
jgi:predicted nucleic acid-binding protein